MTNSRRDLTAMLRPRSIALVGATDRSRWSQNTFDNLINRKYPGEVHLVSRRGGTVHGRNAATSCVAVGAPIDLALLMVPMAAVDEALADLAAAGADLTKTGSAEVSRVHRDNRRTFRAAVALQRTNAENIFKAKCNAIGKLFRAYKNVLQAAEALR